MNIDKTQLYNDIMSSISIIVKQKIDESFGIKEYDNIEFNKEIQNISAKIINTYNNGLQYNAILIENDNQICELQQLKFTLKSIEWLVNLHIYLTCSTILSNDNDVFLVDNQIYMYDTNARDNISTYNYEFQIFNGDTIIEPYITDNNKIIQASIIISIPNKNNIFNIEELSSIIQHELSHIYDLFSQKKRTKHLNTDLLEVNSYLDIPENSWFIINKLLNNSTTIKVKKGIIKEKIDASTLNNIFVDNIYLLNKSEMRARLHNCRYEIKHNIYKIRNEIINKDLKQDLLRKISAQFNTYYILHEIFKLFVKYIPDNIKEDFVNEVISKKFGKERPNGYEPKYPYNKSFKNKNNTYDLSSFDKFFTYHIDNIYNIFLKNAISIFEQYFYQDPKAGLKIMSENYYQRNKRYY